MNIKQIISHSGKVLGLQENNSKVYEWDIESASWNLYQLTSKDKEVRSFRPKTKRVGGNIAL